MICKVLTYSLTLLTIVAGLFVMSACQKEDVGKSEVMMTFNTRAIVSDAASDADALEQMKDLRVIMVRQDGTVVDNHLAEGINASSVKFTFSTPVKTGGEYFTFYAVANENALTPIPAENNLLSWMKTCQRNVELTEQNITAIKIQEIGNGSAFTIPNGEAIPQTKIWTVYVPQQDKYAVPDPLQLEYVASKISVKFVNQTNESQSLSNIRITGITPNGKGRLFSDYVKNGTHDTYSEVYVESDVQLANNHIPFSNVESLAATETSAIQTYYTYPVDAANISNPMLYATWGEKEFHMPIGVTSIPRNKHIEIVVNILQGKLTVDYNVKEWKEHELNIGGAPTAPDKNDGYYVEDWFADNNINIGGGTVDAPVWNLGGGVTLEGEEVETNWESLISTGGNDVIPNLKLPNNMTINDIEGYVVLIEFKCYNDNKVGESENNPNFEFEIWFMTDHYDNGVISKRNPNNQPFKWNPDHTNANIETEPYVRYVTIDSAVIDVYNKHSNNNTDIHTKSVLVSTGKQAGIQFTISKLKLIKPTSVTALP